MSVARCREINARLRAAGITVHEWPGWEARGNGQSSAYEGCVVHHTASAFGSTPAVLVDGRKGLSGPLANYAGNADGSVTVVAAHPANHAGASGGKSMGPLPVTSLFNKRTLGLEIVYPGTVPMRDAQYRTALIWARVVTDVCGYGDIERARAHAETSITGKWDPGYAPSRTINMAAFRAAARIRQETVLEEDDDVKPKICRWSGSDKIWAVTPIGHWQLKTWEDVNDFAFKWGLPRDSAGRAVVERNDRVGWFGPNLTDLLEDAAMAAAAAVEPSTTQEK